VITDPALHRRSHAQRFMNAAEIIERAVQCERPNTVPRRKSSAEVRVYPRFCLSFRDMEDLRQNGNGEA
jgi:hypothetical protein